MNKLDNDTCDDIALKLSGLIGLFELIVNILGGPINNEKRAMLDFSFFISHELQDMYKTVSGIDYFD